MKINRKKLLDALKRIQPAVANKPIIEQTDSVCFEKEAIRAYNDFVAITIPIKTNIEGGIQANRLISLLDKMTTKKVKLNPDKANNMLNIETKRIKASIRFDRQIKLPIVAPKNAKWAKLPSDFCPSVLFASFSASRTMAMPVLSGIYIEKDIVLSFDNFRATKVKIKEQIESPILIPAIAAIELVKYNPTLYTSHNNWLHFKNDQDSIFSCRAIEGDYPKKSILKLFEDSDRKIKLPNDFGKIIDRIQVMVDSEFDQDRIVNIKFKKGEIVCKGEGTLGWIEERIVCDYSGENISIQVHPEFLIQILEHLEEIDINKNLLYFKGENFEHAISRVK